ncbi:nucleotidyltransferase [Candidatus Woesearchaeota archaeon]|jgi:predicted transcriptional regulator|nr:nucleotidyltransferase [Candidatus Woesearchaeota archaeon]MBT6519973.1 nucleotidyltransferase [Candidatus Woesearchaeota archaeon]MBT7367826.1 nucleotidyltransferase [Candidatus Woesearchaeota archaeon]
MKETLIISYLLENKKDNYSIRSISKAVNIDYKNTHNIIKRLESQGIISLEQFGNANKINLEQKNHPFLFKTEFERREKIFKNKNIKLIYEQLNELNKSFIALLFGSQVRKPSEKSDYDLLIISEECREIETNLSILNLDIHVNSITHDEFIQMLQSNEFSVVSEAVNHNIVLIGIENYYKLIENANKTTNKRGRTKRKDISKRQTAKKRKKSK